MLENFALEFWHDLGLNCYSQWQTLTTLRGKQVTEPGSTKVGCLEAAPRRAET